ncbi:MAG: 3-hydroxypropionyl-CoA synthetase [Gammaproteobacteria bacterium SG8_11]|nr:MAG: 3-hydroxypropionyl-CoA synthetase [Gammaproteobacteria bacterium SG8_11]
MANENIQSILQEERQFPPSTDFAAKARIKQAELEQLNRQASEDYEGFWSKLAHEEITWQTPFNAVLDSSNAPHFKWFHDGKLNVSYNCLDRHLADKGDKTAIIFEGEQGDVEHITYNELHKRVCQFANGLKALGIKNGDRVVIYMPMVPEAAIAMQACARIGAIHSVVFGGFSAESLKDRIEDAGAVMLITADGGHRGGKIVELKAAADKALSEGCVSINKVVVLQRTNHSVPMQSGRDVSWDEVMANQATECEPEWVDAEHPLFLLYTSGSTGKPKGIQHSTAGYLLNCIVTMKWVFDINDNDIYWCTADVGWITGHSYVTYGPLATGSTMLMYEGAPSVPDFGRFWKICQDHKVTVFYTAPTAIRALMKQGDHLPESYDLSSLRLLGTVGEPINPEAWMWYHRTIGKEHCPIVDTWWQTETGANMIAPVPGVVATKPGSCTRPLPGIEADIVDEDGNSITTPNQGGYLVIKKPWPSMLRTIWGDDQRYKDTYWGKFHGKYYLAGDSARRDEDGYFWIMGRIDDVLNVSGHRLGTMEIESALVANPKVAEAAVVGRPDEIKGEGIFAFVVLKGKRPAGGIDETLTKELRQWVSEQIGPIAKPDEIRYADNLPKTRSGKIMRRLLRSIANGEAITQDTSTLENEAILLQLQGKE